jgi:hypothetical protein
LAGAFFSLPFPAFGLVLVLAFASFFAVALAFTAGLLLRLLAGFCGAVAGSVGSVAA